MEAAQGASWDSLMTLAYGWLRLPPDVFWAMTPREFDCAARAVLPPPPARTTRHALTALMAAHPDGALAATDH